MFGRKKRLEKKLINSSKTQNEIIQSSLKKIKGLIVLYEEYDDVCEALRCVYNQYSNATVSGKKEVVTIDSKISNLLSEIELCLKKVEKSKDLSEVYNTIKQINKNIAER